MEKLSNTIAQLQQRLLTSPAQTRVEMTFALPTLPMTKEGQSYYSSRQTLQI
jgi:hypothetical protein